MSAKAKSAETDNEFEKQFTCKAGIAGRKRGLTGQRLIDFINNHRKDPAGHRGRRFYQSSTSILEK